MVITKWIIVFVIWCMGLLCWPMDSQSTTQIIHFPVVIDYSFIRSAFIQQAFTQPGGRATPLNTKDGCTQIDLWDPKAGPEKSSLKLSSTMKIKTGFPIAGNCMQLAEWQGPIDILQRIVVDEKGTKMAMQAMEFKPMGLDKTNASVNKMLTDLIQSSLSSYFGKMSIDLTGTFKGLQDQLPNFFSTSYQSGLGAWLSSIRINGTQLKPEGIVLDVIIDVDAAQPSGDVSKTPESKTEIQRLIKTWEEWDAFSVYQLQAVMGQPVTDDEKDNVLEALLDRRYEFVQALEDGALSQDLILRQFTENWQKLSDFYRKHLAQTLSNSPADYLSFIATSDALVALSKTGLGSGLNVNHDGLLKLMKLLGGTKAETDLHYSPGVNRSLQTFFGLGQSLDDPELSMNISAISLLKGDSEAPYYADESDSGLEQAKAWIFKKENVVPYLSRIRLELEWQSSEILSKAKLDAKYQSLFPLIMQATAWQESCWRQFVEKQGKVSPIYSYNKSSVGMMQINERVWRGIYQPESLQWNARYNIRAGSEILDLYMRKYALRKPESRNISNDLLAMAVYAMYNGGPGQFKKFLARTKNNTQQKTDKLFWEKYWWTKNNQVNKVSVCLTGK
ncbi:MAG: lytic transglycosylase domain-containing protein [Proteobacteria bacterium]|nr:lytic transglycosylase domain-containing protein [Pseudomonadota bacterium]